MTPLKTLSRNPPSKRKVVVLGLVAVLLANLAVHVWRERSYAVEVRRLGGSLNYQCGSVHRIHFSPHSPFSDADLQILASFRDLAQLDLTQTKVTSNGISQLRNFRRLELVQLRKDQITDEQEHELMSGDRPIGVCKYSVASNGMLVVDGFE